MALLQRSFTESHDITRSVNTSIRGLCILTNIETFICIYFSINFCLSDTSIWKLHRCSTVLESLAKLPSDYLAQDTQQDLQKIRILVGPPLRRPLKHPLIDESFPNLPSPAATEVSIGITEDPNTVSATTRPFIHGRVASHPLGDLVVYCTTDFATLCKQVHVRTRRVRLLGLKVSKLLTY